MVDSFLFLMGNMSESVFGARDVFSIEYAIPVYGQTFPWISITYVHTK